MCEHAIRRGIGRQQQSVSAGSRRNLNERELNQLNELMMDFGVFESYMQPLLPNTTAINRLNRFARNIEGIVDQIPTGGPVAISTLNQLVELYRRYKAQVQTNSTVLNIIQADEYLTQSYQTFRRQLRQVSAIPGITARETTRGTRTRTTRNRNTSNRSNSDRGFSLAHLLWWGRETPQQHARRMDSAFRQIAEETRRRELQGNSFRVFFALSGNQNVIYEYRNGRRSRTLTFSNQRGRNYYRVGDIFLPFTMEQRQMLDIYPELATQQEGRRTALQYLAEAFGSNQRRYGMGYKIARISALNDGTGRGQVVVHPVIFFSNSDIVELQTTRTWNRTELHRRFATHHITEGLMSLVPVLETTAELATIPITRGTRAIARRVGRRVLARGARAIVRRSLRRLFIRIVRTLRGSAVSAIRKFITELVKDLIRQHQDSQMRRRAGATPRQVNVQAAIERAAAKAATTLISETLGRRLSRHIDRSIREVQQVDPVMGRTLRQRLERYISREIVKLFTEDKVNIIMRTVTNAHATALRERGDRGELTRYLMAELKDQLLSHLRGKIDNLAEGFGDHIDI